jgi:hypothetical protein
MKRAFGAGILIVVLSIPAPASSGGRADTTVKFKSVDYQEIEGTYTFSGTISSPAKACVEGRKVIVYREGGIDDTRLGADRAGKDGARWRWQVSASGPLMASSYYARAKPTDECRGDKSETYEDS